MITPIFPLIYEHFLLMVAYYNIYIYIYTGGMCVVDFVIVDRFF